MKFGQIVEDIKTLKIQGAENVAKAAIDAWAIAKDKKKATKVLVSLRPTEPMLRNALKYLNSGKDPEELKKEIDEELQKIATFGSRLIGKESLVYTHCHSSTVEAILKKAKLEGKKLEVHATETRPDYQGRITAANLAKAGIKVTLYVDSAAPSAMRDADMMLIGCDAITAYGGIINKIGSQLFAKVATEMGIPVYVACHSLKFDTSTRYGKVEKIEERSDTEVWPNHPRGVKIVNNVFDFVSQDYISAMITELGVMPYAALVERLKGEKPFLFGD